MHKTVGHEYLGIILDTQKMEARLPQEKIDRICDFIFKLLKRSSCTKRELLQLPGHLNFASPVILPWRSFVSYLIKLSTTVSELHHFVHLNKECRIDLEFWLRFLKNWNGINMFYSAFVISNFDMELFTDASSTLGFGSFFRGKWFYSSWPSELNNLTEGHLSTAFLELYPVVVAAILWGESWKSQKILFWSDNVSTVDIIRKGRSKCLYILKLMRKLTCCACTYNLSFSAKHIPGFKNEISDSLSRFQIQRFKILAPGADLHPCPCPDSSEVMWR